MGMSVLLITHDLRCAQAADEVIVMYADPGGRKAPVDELLVAT
jgi:ABC-type dipeptide/oligopeptide/nickel transport system ATPase component